MKGARTSALWRVTYATGVARSAVLVGAATVLVPAVIGAQQTALPVQFFANQAVDLTTLTIQADALLLDRNAGPYRPLAGRLILNMGRFGIAAGLGGLFDPQFSNKVSIGGSFGVDFYTKSPSGRKVTAQIGAGYAEPDDPSGAPTEQLTLPVGVGMSWHFPPLDWNAEPWVGPIVLIRRSSRAVPASEVEWKAGFGFTMGITVYNASGPGIQTGVQVVRIDQPFTGSARTEVLFSVGARWKLAFGI